MDRLSSLAELYIHLQTYEMLLAISEIPKIERSNDVEPGRDAQSSQV